MAKRIASAEAGLLAAAELAETGDFVERFELARCPPCTNAPFAAWSKAESCASAA